MVRSFDSSKLKVGDKVVVDHRGWESYMTVETVENITTKGLVDVSGVRYGTDGCPHIRSGNKYLLFWTPELQKIIDDTNHRNEVLKKIRDIKWSTISTSKIDRILDILNEKT